MSKKSPSKAKKQASLIQTRSATEMDWAKCRSATEVNRTQSRSATEVVRAGEMGTANTIFDNSSLCRATDILHIPRLGSTDPDERAAREAAWRLLRAYLESKVQLCRASSKSSPKRSSRD